MNDFSNREVAIFTEAMDMPAQERAAHLERACAGDEQLRQKVEALLHTHDNAGDFLEQPAGLNAMQPTPRVSAGAKAGDRIGRYKLLQQIGEGGCGVVYLAEQEDPVRRPVALKIIKPGMDTKNVIARFEAERQALALMNHPNIAKVFDAGATESGRPYFVMELIRGVKITEYCEQNSLTIEERLRLFVQVCHAVQHAHQKGIIHRDIKPSNILLTCTQQGAAVPVVIDFGIAKATTRQRLTDKTLFTAFDLLIGTPAYMSPEQAALASIDVDTRTDIYSLGVLLYELLTGLTPFDTAELLKAGFDEIRRAVREQEPVCPSMRLSKMAAADLTTVAAHRNSDPPALIRTVCGDLDWMVMKALDKDRTRRYETADGMALDVQRYLANEPILARPPSKLYKLQMTMRRNKLLFTGLGLFASLLVLGLIVIAASLAQERHSRREAEAESIKSQQVTRFLENMLQGVGPSVALGRDTTMMREILDRTAENVGAEMTNQPAVEAELRRLVGQLYLEIGNYEQAEKMQRTGLAINRKLFTPESRAAAASLNELGVALWKEGKLAEAEAAHLEALAIRRRLFGNENGEVATSLGNLADVYRRQGKTKEAEALIREALGIGQKLFGNESLAAANSLRNLSIVLCNEGKLAEAEAMAREVLAIRRKLLGQDHPQVASALVDIAWIDGYMGKGDEAESLEREALAMRQKLLGGEHPDVAKSFYLLGDRVRQRGQLNEAYSFLSAALSIQRKLLGEENPASLDTLRSLGLVLESQGKWAEAEMVQREARTLWNKRGNNQTPQAVSVLESLAHVLLAQQKTGDAEQLLDEALTPAFISEPSSGNLLALRASLRARRSQWPEAAADAALAFEHQPLNNERYSVLAALLVKTHNYSAYQQLCQKLLTNFSNTTSVYLADQVAKSCLFLPPSEADLPVITRLAEIAVTHGTGDSGALPYFQDGKALAEYRLGHFTEAVEWAQKPLQITGLSVHGHAYAVLAMACWRLGEKDKAQAMLAKGNELAPRILPARDAEDPGNKWLAWLFARIQLDEATALIQPALTNDKLADKP